MRSGQSNRSVFFLVVGLTVLLEFVHVVSEPSAPGLREGEDVSTDPLLKLRGSEGPISESEPKIALREGDPADKSGPIDSTTKDGSKLESDLEELKVRAKIAAGESEIPLRPDDGDPNIGGAGRDTTCPVPTASLDHDSHPSPDDNNEPDDISSMSSKQVRAELQALGVKTTGCVEKSDFVAKLREARAAQKAGLLLRGSGHDDNSASGGGHGTCPLPQDEVPAEMPKKTRQPAETKKSAQQQSKSRKVQTAEESSGAIDVEPVQLMPIQSMVDDNGTVWLQEDLREIIHNATKLRDPTAQMWLGRLFESGAVDFDGNVTVPRDPTQAAEFYSEAANQGLPEAARRLGELFATYDHDQQALEALTLAVQLGDVPALAGVAGLLENAGQMDQAVKLYRKAAAQGDPAANAALGRLHLHGAEGVDKNMKLALQYKRSAERGSPAGCHNLARCYRDGKGTDASMSLAEQWIMAAAEDGADAALQLDDHRFGYGMEREGLDPARVMVGGRPSQYTYHPIKNRPVSPEEAAKDDEVPFDGVYSVDLQGTKKVRWSFAGGGPAYWDRPGVLYPPFATPAAAGATGAAGKHAAAA